MTIDDVFGPAGADQLHGALDLARDRNVKLTFFRGASLDPVPPEPSKVADTRYFHIREDDEIDEQLLTNWFRQASALPGERL